MLSYMSSAVPYNFAHAYMLSYMFSAKTTFPAPTCVVVGAVGCGVCILKVSGPCWPVAAEAAAAAAARWRPSCQGSAGAPGGALAAASALHRASAYDLEWWHGGQTKSTAKPTNGVY